MGATQCTSCPPGQICPNPASLPSACPQGSYPNTAQTACSSCPAGSSCPDPAQAKSSCTTPSTYASSSGMTECLPCPAGQQCNIASNVPASCVTSSYFAPFGSGTCAQASSGSFAPSSSMTSYSCPTGTYTSTAGSIRCNFCSAGKQCPSTNASPSSCASGSVAANASSQCTSCLPGYTCPDSTQASMTACADGYYSSSNACIRCPQGSFCNETAVLGTCPLGTTSELGYSLCRQCPPGYACPSPTSTPTACLTAQYVDPLTFTCQSCPVGKECPTPSSTPQTCALGYYSLVGSSQCQVCPEGSYCPSPGQLLSCTSSMVSGLGYLACTQCPSGYSCPTQKLSSITKCSTGSYSLLGETTCTQCLPGASCPQATSPPQTCLPGTWSSAASSTSSCQVCSAGQWCPSTGTTTPSTDAVPKNNYNGFGTTSELVCPGTAPCAFDTTHQSLTCAPGEYFVPRDSVDCQPCVAGSNYCQSGKMAQCPAGTYGNQTVLGHTEACAECLDQRLCQIRGAFPSGQSVVQNYCYKRGDNLQYVSNLTNAVRFSSYDYQSCYDCNTTAFKDSICTFTGPYFTTQSGSTLQCPWGSASFNFFDTTSNTSYSVSKYWESGYDHAFCQRNMSQLPPMWTNATSLTCGSINQYTDPKYGTCKSIAAGFVNLGSNMPTAAPIQALYSTLTQDQFGTAVKGTECSWSSDTVMQGGSMEYQACMMRASGACLFSSSDYCHDGAEFMCPAGFSTLTNQAHKALGDCVVGSAGSYSNSTSKSYQCDAGRFCLDMTQDVAQYAARPGTMIGSSGSSSFTAEVACTAGYCPPASSTETKCPSGYKLDVSSAAQDQHSCHPVSQGTYLNPSTGVSIRCTVGSYCPEAVQVADQMLPCPTGTYGASEGLGQKDECLPCPLGSSCPLGTALAAVQNCPAGYFCPNVTKFTREFACPAGTYSTSTANAQSASQCKHCDYGAYCQEGSSASVTCPYNKYCPSGAAYQVDCSAGTLLSALGKTSQSECVSCGPSHFCPGGSDGISCPSGTYMDGSGATECKPNPIGGSSVCGGTPGASPAYFATSEGSSQCLLCPAGSYCPGSSILPCPAGSYCPQGSAAPQACVNGAYCNTTSVSTVQWCPAGNYCPDGDSPRGTPINFYNVGKELSGTLHMCGDGFLCMGNSTGPYDQPCPANTYVLPGETFCRPCAAGSYCPIGSGYLQPCPLGWFCLTGAAPQKCQAGSYGAKVNLTAPTDCTPCPAGSTCSENGLIAADGLCDPGYYCIGGSWTPQPSNQNALEAAVGGLCPIGSYCPRGSSSPQACPLGTFNSFPGMRAASDCIPCTVGFYCQNANSSTPTGPCFAGYYCTGGSSSPTQVAAQPGHYALNGSAAQIECLPGTYSSQSGGVNCTQCDPGKYCDTFAMQVGIPCPAGFYCPLGSIIPLPCPLGTANPNMNAKSIADCINCTSGHFADSQAETLQVDICQPGYFCMAGSPSATPAVNLTLAANSRYTGSYGLCPRGHWCPIGTSTPQACPVGYFLDSEGAYAMSQCKLCTAGSYCATVGLAQPTGTCQEGYWCGVSSAASTVQDSQCGAGTYCPVGSIQATQCPAGTYSSSPGASTCDDCPLGYYCPEGSSSPLVCPKGSYCPSRTEYANQYLCPSGTYNDLEQANNSTACLICPPDSYCAASGAVRVSGLGTGGISDGYYNGNGGSVSSIPSTSTSRICSIGYYCKAGLETPCPTGSYCNSYGLSSAAGYCLAGFYCVQGSTSMAPTNLQTQMGATCPAGFFCQSGYQTSVPVPCSIGSYSNSTGLSSPNQCKSCTAGYVCNLTNMTNYSLYPCPKGTYCPPGTPSTDEAQSCPRGSYCPVGSSYPLACQEGSYNPSLNQSECMSCQSGNYCPYQASSGTPNQLICPKGYFCNQAGLTSPTPCPIGYYQDQDGQTSCKSCQAGYFCDVLGIDQILDTRLCPGGFYCPTGTSLFSSFMCTPGFYCPSGSSAPLACPSGQFCAGYALQTTSGSCESGYYCLNGAKQPNPIDTVTGGLCPMGSYCTAGSTVSAPCPSGTYNDKQGAPGPDYCLSCPANKVCDELGLAYPKDACPAGYYCPANAAPQPCATGHYCPASASVMLKCPLGSYQDQTQQVVCKPCPAGYYCGYDSNNLLTSPSACPPGFFCPANSSDYEHNPCPLGTYSPQAQLKAQTECKSCDEAAFCNKAGLSQPTGKCIDGYLCQTRSSSMTGTSPCPQNYYCQAGVAIECPAGTYNKNTGATSVQECVQCPPGKFCTSHFSLIENCPAGFYCQGNLSSRDQATPCPVGNYCPSGSVVPLKCDPGTFSGNPGAQSCTKCPSGTYCDQPGLTTPKPCLVNLTCPVGSVYPKACPKGQYSDANSGCQPCPAGQYCWPEVGSNGVQGRCEAGYVCQNGSYSPRPYFKVESITSDSLQFKTYNGPAFPGYYSSDGSSNLVCPIGQFQPSKYAQGCLTCYAGKYCPYKGMSSLSAYPCQGGYICYNGSTTSQPKDGTQGSLCPAGYYCTNGALQAMTCPDGYYTSSQGQASCLTCPPENYCNNTLVRTGGRSMTGCTLGSTCSGGNAAQPLCDAGYYLSNGQCQQCTLGKYCTGGQVAGPCAAGFYCTYASSVPNLSAQLCPVGKYCPIGTTYLATCPDGLYTVSKGGQQRSDCAGCLPGYVCNFRSGSPVSCPKGFYCPIGTTSAVACPIGTYSAATMLITMNDCSDCPAGYLCSASNITDYTRYPCPTGFFCPKRSTYTIPCPSGTYRDITGATSTQDCITCPAGYYCPQATTSPWPCLPGTYCPLGSKNYTTCLGGYFCNADTNFQLQLCPINKVCPRGTSDPQTCGGRLVCPLGSELGQLCPSGNYVKNNSLAFTLNQCLACPAGTYSTLADTICQQCEGGYLCYGQTNRRYPTNYTLHKGEVCSKGHYCPLGSFMATPCPSGTYNPSTQASSATQCRQCPEGTFGVQAGQAGCAPCGAYASAVEGQTTCSCKGAYRVFSKVDSSCRCKSGYDFIDSASGMSQGQQSSGEDCIPIVYDRCQDVNQTRDVNGLCVDIGNCSLACSGGNGTRSPTLGICTCSDTRPVDSVCNQNCRASAPKMNLVSGNNYTVTQNGRTSSLILSSLGDVYGSLNCTTPECRIVHAQSTLSGQFNGKYGVSDTIELALQNKNRRILQVERSLADTASMSSDSIVTPVVCLNNGDSMLFTIATPYHYPVYKKDSVINSNPAFDYGSFLTLSQAMVTKQANNDTSTSFFAFTFSESGSYVFIDAQDQEQIMVVIVTEIGQTCADSDRYIQTLTLNSAASFGLNQKGGLILKPNIRLLIGMGAILVLSTALIVLGIGYCLRKGWTIKRAAVKGFRQTNSLISIEHTNNTTYHKLNDFETFKTNLIDSEEDDIDNINLDIHQDLLAAGQEYLSVFDKERSKRIGFKNEKRAEILKMMKELEEMICTIGSDAISNQMQLYNESGVNEHNPNKVPLMLKQQEERDKQLLEIEQQRRRDLINGLPENDKAKLMELKEQYSKDLNSLKKDLGKNTSSQNEHTGKHDHEEVAFAIYDNGDVKSRQNQMVKKIELDLALSEEDKENLLRGHEKNLGQIDTLMEAEKKRQESELEKALEERADRRRKKLEALHKKDISNDYKSQEQAVRDEVLMEKQQMLLKLEEEYEQKIGRLEESHSGARSIEERQWLSDLKKERDEKRAEILKQYDQETISRLQQLKDSIIDKYMAVGQDLESALRDQLLSQSDEVLQRARAKRQDQKLQLKEKCQQEQAILSERLDNEKRELEAELESKDLIKEEEIEKKKRDVLKSNNLLEGSSDPQLEFNKVLQGIDSELQQSQLLDQFKEQDQRLMELLKQSDEGQNAKLQARRELLKQRKLLKQEQEQEQLRLKARLKQIEDEDHGKALIEENYVRELFGQIEQDEGGAQGQLSTPKKLQLLNEYTTDAALSRLSNLLMKQFVEKEAALKLLLQKYMDQRLLEKANLKQQFKSDYQRLDVIRSQLPETEFNEILKGLRLKEENLLREVDLQFDKAYKEEETKLRQDLEKKHVEESIVLRKQDVDHQIKLKAELLNEVNKKEEEQEKKALKTYEEVKRREQERKVRALGMQKQDMLREIEQEMQNKYSDYDELLRRKREEENLIQEQALSIRAKLQDRRRKIREAGALLSKEDQQKLLDQHKKQLEVLDSVWEEERRRQILVMQKKLEQRKAKAVKQSQMKQLIQQQEFETIKDKLGCQLDAVYEEEVHELQEEDNLLIKMLKEWKIGRQEQRALEQMYKLADTAVELEPNTLRRLMLKLDALERSLKELKRIKKVERQEYQLSGLISPALSPPHLEASIIYEDDEELEPRQSLQLAGTAPGAKASKQVVVSKSSLLHKAAPTSTSPTALGKKIDYSKIKKFMAPHGGKR